MSLDIQGIQNDLRAAKLEDRGRIARVAAGRDAVLRRAGRVAQKPGKNSTPRETRRHAVFSEKRNSIRGDGGRGHD